MPSRPRRGRTAALLTPALTALSPWLLLLPPPCRSVHLDVHVPLPSGCLEYHALLANRLLRGASEVPQSNGDGDGAGGGDEKKGEEGEEAVPQPSEQVDLFSLHTPHVTLYLADFDLEADVVEEVAEDTTEEAAGSAPAERPLNDTKVDAFVASLSSLNFTEILGGWACPLTLARDPSTSDYYKIRGAYVMLQVQDTPCLQTLSTTLLRSLQSYLKSPVEVPKWVMSLAEPQRSAAIDRTRTYGSPNVLEGFDPHVTVGYDDNLDVANRVRWRLDTMGQWNDAYAKISGECFDEVEGIALGRTGIGGTVLAGSRMGYWKLDGTGKSGGSAPQSMNWNDFYNNEVM